MRRYFAGTGASHRERQDRCGSTRGSHDRSFFYKEAHFGRSCIPAADEWHPPGGHPASGYPPGGGRFPQPVQRCGENLPVSDRYGGKDGRISEKICLSLYGTAGSGGHGAGGPVSGGHQRFFFLYHRPDAWQLQSAHDPGHPHGAAGQSAVDPV